jgi:acetylcholinesterase
MLWTNSRCKLRSWGESAGAMSVGLHMLINGGQTDGLFRGAIMQSGSPPPIGDISHGQIYYDNLVSATNCTNAADKLQCLRLVPAEQLQSAVNASPSFFSNQVSSQVANINFVCRHGCYRSR